MIEQKNFLVEAAQAGRLDKALVQMCGDLSRSRIQNLIATGCVWVNGQICTVSSRRLDPGDGLALVIPELVAAFPQAENIALDIVFEDEDMLVINKPVGMVVHPGAGNQEGTLVNALLAHCGDTLSGIGGVARPGIVHRLDKDTSGLMAVAKTDRAHKGLAAQLESRTLSRTYLAVVLKVPFPPKAVIDRPLGRHPKNRLKMAVNNRDGRLARTHYWVQEDFGGACALVECKLETGRTHQIRVHMESLGHPLIGDPLYGPQPNAVRSAMKKAGYDEVTAQNLLSFPRQALHACALAFIHPVTENEMSFICDLPDDMNNILKSLTK